MNNKKELFKASIIMVVVVLVFSLAMWGLNFYTEPLIEKNKAGAANEALNAVMPNNNGFTDITSTLIIDAESGVYEVYKENKGAGYVIKAQKQGYSKLVSAVCGISSDGKIVGLTFDSNGDFEVPTASINQFIGLDSALSGVELKNGATYSTTALKELVEAAFNLLVQNNMITAGVKSDEQVLEELLPTVFNSFEKGTELSVTGNIIKAYEASNKTGFAYFVINNDETLLVIVNNDLSIKCYKPTHDDINNTYGLEDVTTNNQNVIDLVKNDVTDKVNNYNSVLENKVKALYNDASEIEFIDSFNTIAKALKFKTNDNLYYAFYSRSINSFNSTIMEVFVIIDEDGKIVETNVSPFFQEEQYFFAVKDFNSKNYTDSLIGRTDEIISNNLFDKGNELYITGATCSTNGLKNAYKDAFNVFNNLKGGNN